VPQTISDVPNVDVFRLECTVGKLFDIFGCVINLAVTLSLKQLIVIFTHAMTHLLVLTNAHCVSCRDAHFELTRVVICFSCAEIRPLTFKLKIPIDVPKMRIFWDNYSIG
jgi:hypothetical protein